MLVDISEIGHTVQFYTLKQQQNLFCPDKLFQGFQLIFSVVHQKVSLYRIYQLELYKTLIFQ